MTAVTEIAGRKHDWINAQQRTLAAHESFDGCDRIEKICPNCGITKITVMPPRGFGYHLWRHPNGNEFQMESTPPCIEMVRSNA